MTKDQPSATPTRKVTLSAIAGTGVTLCWEFAEQFTDVDFRASLIATSVLFVTMTVAYFTKERA